MTARDIITVSFTETSSIVCRSEEQKAEIEKVINKIGIEVFQLLMQARGWAAVWLEAADVELKVHKEITREFIDKVDEVLKL